VVWRSPFSAPQASLLGYLHASSVTFVCKMVGGTELLSTTGSKLQSLAQLQNPDTLVLIFYKSIDYVFSIYLKVRVLT
jgi:hypothetical protein